jgi:hypothetical protein
MTFHADNCSVDLTKVSKACQMVHEENISLSHILIFLCSAVSDS